jgi:hypothetical protein
MDLSATGALATSRKAVDLGSALHHPTFLDVMSHALNTFAQQFVVILLATGPGLPASQHWAAALVTSLWAFGASILLSLAFMGTDRFAAMEKVNANPHGQAAVRVTRTFFQSFLGCMAASTISKTVTYGWKASAAIAVCVAFLALLKALATLNSPKTRSPAVNLGTEARIPYAGWPGAVLCSAL